MKVLRKREVEEFIPIQIVFETQEEVDKIYALFNNSKIAHTLQIANANCDNPWWEKLKEYKDEEGTIKWHEKLENLMNK